MKYNLIVLFKWLRRVLQKNFYINTHAIVRTSGVSNFKASRIPVHICLGVQVWKSKLQEYTDSQLVELLKFRFSLGYEREFLLASLVQNHRSALEFPEAVGTYLTSEIKQDRILGPFQGNPLGTSLTIFALNPVPKKDSSDRRFISDLSFPKTLFLSSGIYKDRYLNELVELLYPSVD